MSGAKPYRIPKRSGMSSKIASEKSPSSSKGTGRARKEQMCQLAFAMRPRKASATVYAVCGPQEFVSS